MTIEVETPSGVKSGSSVVAVRWRKNDSFSASSGPRWISRIRGEAPVVDLGDGRYLFALLRRPVDYEYTGDLATRLIFKTARRARGRRQFGAVRDSRSEMMLVPKSLYPRLLGFTDITDAGSATLVDPDNLAASFGPEFELRRISFEITDEPVSDIKITKLLGWWLSEAKGIYSPPVFVASNPKTTKETKIGIRNFVQGVEWREK